jgi:membrane protein
MIKILGPDVNAIKSQLQDLFALFYRLPGIRLLMAALQRFKTLGHKTHAAALTYTTLFALVPLITVSYSVLSMIPVLQQGQGDLIEMMLGNLVPASGDALMGYLHQFSLQARQLTLVGIVLLVITAFMMLRTIENSFNQVWQLKQGRKGLSSFLLYWAILSLGPLMLSAGVAVSSYISSLALWKEDWVPTTGILTLAIVVPYIASFLAFTLIYWAVPNCNVPLKHAAIGGAFVALLFEIGQEIFAEASTFFPSYQLIYGAFAAVPLFLLWLYISWSVILLGAELVYLQDSELEDESNSCDKMMGLNILTHMLSAQAKGQGLSRKEIKLALTEPSINQAHGKKISTLTLIHTLNNLVALKLLLKQADGRYFLIRDLSKYSLYEYFQHLAPKDWPEFSQSGSMGIAEMLIEQEEKLKTNLSVSLLSLLVKDK